MYLKLETVQNTVEPRLSESLLFECYMIQIYFACKEFNPLLEFLFRIDRSTGE